jgi:hypothetical protein
MRRSDHGIKSKIDRRDGNQICERIGQRSQWGNLDQNLLGVERAGAIDLIFEGRKRLANRNDMNEAGNVISFLARGP